MTIVKPYGELVKSFQQSGPKVQCPRLTCVTSLPRPDAQSVDRTAYDLAIDFFTRLTADDKLAPREADVVLIMAAYEGEVFNGGHHQLFFNSAGDQANEMREALARMGDPIALQTLDCALSAFPGSAPPVDRQERIDLMGTWGDGQFEVWDELDRYFYEVHPTCRAIATYVRAHLDEMPTFTRTRT